MAVGGGSSTSPPTMASRVNQPTSSSSSSRTAGSPAAHCAEKPSMSEVGKGHGCEER